MPLFVTAAAFIALGNLISLSLLGSQAYQLKTKRQQQEIESIVSCISLLSVFLLVAIFLRYKQMKGCCHVAVVDTNTL